MMDRSPREHKHKLPLRMNVLRPLLLSLPQAIRERQLGYTLFTQYSFILYQVTHLLPFFWYTSSVNRLVY
jgi:hypothetical protein